MARWGVSILVLGLALNCSTKGQATKDVRDIVGVTHVAGKYHLTEQDFLNEGADQILALGSRVIKVWFCCNELKGPNAVMPVVGANNYSPVQVRGFWLIRPDGTKAWTWDYFHGLFTSTRGDLTVSR